ncbi:MULTISPECIES: phage tail sheath subtilisin-like domain-containing protein [unclassified Bradyrhizobium]|uniref:phage tail sheath subtilisin-like domain-containing protein n=1 Tax=unclassified Bradyrhizobium TaxID=2631580 RepID=UPI002915DEB2|nr:MULTISPECIES: phage tail sheath subtilisin-like domain-containing protein [unclassified Bradyrhizobium]
MSVLFNNIPGNQLVPFFYAEINSGGTPYQNTPRVLLLGQKTNAGLAATEKVFGPIQNEREAIAQFGLGSILVDEYRRARKNAPFQPLWAMPLAEPAGANAAGSLTFTAPGVTGAAILWLLGRRVVFQVNASDTAANVATTAAAAINKAALPYTAAVDGTTPAKVNVTSVHKGAIFNGQEMTFATDESNVLNAGNVNVSPLAGGSGVPDLVAALANLGDQEYDFIAGPYSDANSLNAVRDFLDDMSGRWSPSQQLYGGYFTAQFGTLSGLVTFGNTRNDPHTVLVGSQRSPTPEWEWAAAAGSKASAHLATAPEVSRPLQTLVLQDVLPPRDRSVWWDIDDRQALYADGIAGYKVRTDGLVAIDRFVTTYQKSAAGVADATFRDVETMYQLTFVVRYLRTIVSNKHSRQALADENPQGLAEITTAKEVRNTLIHAYQDLVALGVTENADLFAEFVVVERDPNDANRLNAYLPVDVVNQLRVFAANITAFLEYRTASGAVSV